MSRVGDILGAYTTDYSGASAARAKNVKNGGAFLDGAVIFPGETYSVRDALEPFDAENGYDPAPSYASGRVEDSFGGGICQLSSTLYAAVLRAELEVVERHNHSMTVRYIETSMDATISDYKDFVFRNNTDYPIYIYMNTDYGEVTARIYGVESRDPSREIRFEGEVLEEDDYETALVATTRMGIGYVKQSKAPYTGIDSHLLKTVVENGVETTEEVNRSHYQRVDNTYEIGVVSASETATSAMYTAIDTNDLDEVYRVINTYGIYRTGNEDEED